MIETPTKLPDDFADRIRRLRAKLGLTQQRLAAYLHVSFASVNRWENKQSRPNRLAWRLILRAEQAGLDAFTQPESARPRDRDDADTVARPDAVTPGIDLTTSSEIVRAVAEAERLTFAHLFNPAFATETSKIDPLPHQRIAVYERMLKHARLRFLLADDAGAGKTIMSGLYIREMLARRLMRRVLIVPPAGLVGNWRREMQTLFNLPFKIASGADARVANPFVGDDSDLVIVSVDTLADPRGRTGQRLGEDHVVPYDLVIFDEAHKLSADRNTDLTVRKTDRYRLAEALAGASPGGQRDLPWTARHLLLLTATPHMGKPYPYYALWRLLEPEILSTFDAFRAFPAEERQRCFIRRTKEEMVRFDGTRIYPKRESRTLSFDLSPAEQELYDQTTAYMETFYNKARILNRSAAKLAMTVFQRRLASSTYAVRRSFERRLAKLDDLIERIRSGEISPEALAVQQTHLDGRAEKLDVFEAMTGDEEDTINNQEANEVAEAEALGGVVAVSLADLQIERDQVSGLLALAQRVESAGEESKFEKLAEVLRDSQFRDEKIIVFTEHYDTLDYLVRRLEGLGFAGKVAQIHGRMKYQERDEQVEFFKRPAAENGATYMIATDAAGEGINLQFCWLMCMFDAPWNPARLEQRFGRIHRYGQEHDPVLLFNLVAGKTREGKVIHRLLEKLEVIRKELRSDKVFDVIGRQFEGVSLKELILRATIDNQADEVADEIDGMLTPEQAKARMEQMEKILGTGGDVAQQLPDQRAKVEREGWRRLLPGYVRRFVQESAPTMSIGIDGDLDDTFTFKPLKPGALDAIRPLIEIYDPEEPRPLTVYKPEDDKKAIFLHPGEPLFDRYCELVTERHGREALKGGVFVDPYAERPYFFHMALVAASRRADDGMQDDFPRSQTLERRLVGIRHEEGQQPTESPVEHLMLLRGSQGVPAQCIPFAATANDSRTKALDYARDVVAVPIAETKRRELLETREDRIRFVDRGYAYQDAELAATRAKLADRVRSGDRRARKETDRVKQQQRDLDSQKTRAVAAIRREPELIEPDEVRFVAHALVVPSHDPVDKERHDREVERVAVKVAWSYEESRGCSVRDVSTAELARAEGLGDWPGFDLLSKHPDGEDRAIEVKGRAAIGDIELSENEWAKACNLRNRYWLYVVFDCGSAHPRLLRVQDPFGKLLVHAKGGVVVSEQDVFDAAEE